MIVVGDHGRGFSRQEKLSARDDNHFGLGILRRRVKEVAMRGGRIGRPARMTMG